jgi:hypothetical protein
MMISTRRFCGSRTPGPVGTREARVAEALNGYRILWNAVRNQLRLDGLRATNR